MHRYIHVHMHMNIYINQITRARARTSQLSATTESLREHNLPASYETRQKLLSKLSVVVIISANTYTATVVAVVNSNSSVDIGSSSVVII